ncbi:hypothetical protein ASH00_08860 [Arthrobacter sp. Soil782]|uniref:hypothetical protein n=1 Tax=Arthrobacter sp. Soil782 TaxID=1736410 RepID=UPI0006F42664|nr:hypothetical protein [Arthrobacter sp. Soil782]KRF06340.1 hypothetical protein ASH00_08860 [Arthrobacter sp. Soil782]
MTGRSANALLEKCGLFYDTDGLMSWLGLPYREIQERREARAILGCPTAEGDFIYPVWQFQDNGELLPGLSSILTVLSSGIDDSWTWALWLQTAVPGELNGRTVTEWLRDGGDVGPVLQLAANDAAGWAT